MNVNAWGIPVTESEIPKVMYHGRKIDSTEFRLDKTGQGNDQEGPGFYFTSSKKDAKGYAHPNGIVMKVELKLRKLLPGTGKPNRREIETMIKGAPQLDDTLMNWDESYGRALEAAIHSMLHQDSPKEAMQQVWADFYRHDPAEYLANLVKLGYDGHRATWTQDGLIHLVVYSPSSIRVLAVEKYRSEQE